MPMTATTDDDTRSCQTYIVNALSNAPVQINGPFLWATPTLLKMTSESGRGDCPFNFNLYTGMHQSFRNSEKQDDCQGHFSDCLSTKWLPLPLFLNGMCACVCPLTSTSASPSVANTILYRSNFQYTFISIFGRLWLMLPALAYLSASISLIIASRGF